MESYGGDFGGAMAGVLTMFLAVFGLLAVLMIVSMWNIYTKAQKPGWAAIVPIYNLLVLLEIVRKPWWWLLLMMIPYVGIVWTVWSINLLAKSFGKGVGFTLGLLFIPFVFFPLLAFDQSQYDGSTERFDY